MLLVIGFLLLFTLIAQLLLLARPLLHPTLLTSGVFHTPKYPAFL